MTPRTIRRTLALAALLPFGFSSGVFGCSSSARFPVCKTDADCSEQAKAKLCYDLRCVQCRNDSDCPDGYCERKVGECRTLGEPGANVSATPPAESPPPESSAQPAK